jgi:hypothetical protein
MSGDYISLTPVGLAKNQDRLPLFSPMGLTEPDGQNTVLANTIENTIGSDNGRIDGSGKHQEAGHHNR